jgi:hypothetical protein
MRKFMNWRLHVIFIRIGDIGDIYLFFVTKLFAAVLVHLIQPTHEGEQRILCVDPQLMLLHPVSLLLSGK